MVKLIVAFIRLHLVWGENCLLYCRFIPAWCKSLEAKIDSRGVIISNFEGTLRLFFHTARQQSLSCAEIWLLRKFEQVSSLLLFFLVL